MKKPVIIITALVALMAGCKIDTTGLPGASGSNAALLIGKWFIKSQGTTITGLGAPVSNTVSNFTSQDFYIFNKDQSVNYSEVTVGNGVGNGSYSYDATAQTLTLIDPNGVSATANVSKLTADSLVYSITVNFQALNTQTIVTTHFAHN